MGHSLIFYVRKKEETKEPIALLSFVGCSDIYTHFRNNNLDFYCGVDGASYKEFTKEVSDELVRDVNSSIADSRLELDALREIVYVNSDVVEDIIPISKHIKYLEDLLEGLEFLENLRIRVEWENNILLYNSY